MERAAEVFARLQDGLTGVVQEVRGAGCLIGLDLGRKAAPVVNALFERGFLVGGASDPHVIRIMPPYTIPFEEVDALCEAVAECLDAVPA